MCEDATFDTYMLPTKAISSGSTAATGLSLKGGKLFHHNIEVEAQMAKDGLKKFIEFVQSFQNPYLVGHNIRNFDVPVLLNQLEQYGLKDDFESSICGFLDTLQISRLFFKKEEVNGSYSQQSLVKSLLNKDYPAHDAVHDVTALQDLFKEKLDTGNELNQFIFYISYYTCRNSLQPLVTMKVLSQSLMRKLAEASLGLSHLRIIHKRDSVNGIHSFLKEFKFCTRSVMISKLVKYFDSVLLK